MAITELEPTDGEMVDKWMMFTKFMLNRVESSELKRMVDEVKDGMNYAVDEQGNIVEADISPFDRELDTLSNRYKEKIQQDDNMLQRLEKRKQELEAMQNMPASEKTKIERQAQIQQLEDLLRGENDDE